jgi:hypothetical protein
MIEAIITGAVAIIVCMINNGFQQKRSDRQHQVTMEASEKQHNTTIALIEYKLDQLTHKVDLHNNAVERLYAVEKKCEVFEEKFRVANHRIEDLEH